MERRRNNVQSPFDDDPYNFDHLLDDIKDQMVEGENYVFDKRGRLVRQGRKKYSQEGIIKLPKIPVGQSRPRSRRQLLPNIDPIVMSNDRRVRVTAPVASSSDNYAAGRQTGYADTNVRSHVRANGSRDDHDSQDNARHNTHHGEVHNDAHQPSHIENRPESNGYNNTVRHDNHRAYMPAPPTIPPAQNSTRRTFQRVPDAGFMSRDASHDTTANLGSTFIHGDGRFQITNRQVAERPASSQESSHESLAETPNSTANARRNELGHYEGDNIDQRIQQTDSFAPRPPAARHPRTRNNDPAYIPAPPTSKPCAGQSYSKNRRRVKYRNQELDQDVSVHRPTVRESFKPGTPLYEIPEEIDHEVNQALEMQRQFAALNDRLDHLKKKSEMNISCSGVVGRMNEEDVNIFIDELDDILEQPSSTIKHDQTKDAKPVSTAADYKSSKSKPAACRVKDEDDIENVDDFLEELDDILKTPPKANKGWFRKSLPKNMDQKETYRKSGTQTNDQFIRELDDILADTEKRNKHHKKDDVDDIDEFMKELDDISYEPTQYRPNSVAVANKNMTGSATPARMPAAANVLRMTTEPLRQWNGETAKRGVGFKSKLRKEEVKLRRPDDDTIPDRVGRKMDEYKTRKNI